MAVSLYEDIQQSTSCDGDVGEGLCLLGSQLVELDLYLSVKTGTCRQVGSEAFSSCFALGISATGNIDTQCS